MSSDWRAVSFLEGNKSNAILLRDYDFEVDVLVAVSGGVEHPNALVTQNSLLVWLSSCWHLHLDLILQELVATNL